MTKFVLAYQGPPGMGKSPEEQQRLAGAWMGWYQRIGPSIVDGGNGFGASSTVTAEGRSNAGRSGFTGYVIVQADDLAAAQDLTDGCPVLTTGGRVEVYEALEHDTSAMRESVEQLVMKYWRSWQGDHPDWAAMRSCLADELDLEHGPMPADELVSIARAGNSWSDVALIDSVFAASQAAIHYRGVDTKTGETHEIAEFLTVRDGKIARLSGILPPAGPPEGRPSRGE